jgi:hypothetical protein
MYRITAIFITSVYILQTSGYEDSIQLLNLIMVDTATHLNKLHHTGDRFPSAFFLSPRTITYITTNHKMENIVIFANNFEFNESCTERIRPYL